MLVQHRCAIRRETHPHICMVHSSIHVKRIHRRIQYTHMYTHACIYTCISNTHKRAHIRAINTWTHAHMHTQARHIGEQLGAALEYMHANDLMHGDVKPLNIVRVDGFFKLIDLDAACSLKNGAKYAAKFSSAYLPPEMVVEVKSDDGREPRLCVRCMESVASRGLSPSELRDASVALDCEWLCACVELHLDCKYVFVCVFVYMGTR